MSSKQTPKSVTANQENDHPPPPEVARLAARLMGSGEVMSSNPKQVTAAVSTARSILMEVSRRPVIHASDLFDPHVVMNTNDVAETFKEQGWAHLKNSNTVASRIDEILDRLHRDIERRRAFVSTAFRTNQLNQTPEDAEFEGKRTIRELLNRLGMSLGLGETLEEVVSCAWSRIVESWLHQTTEVANRLEQTRLHTPEYFDSVFVDRNYETHTASLTSKPPSTADAFLNVILALENEVGPKLASNGIPEDTFKKLANINRWPERLFPDDRSLAQPFKELLQDGFLEEGDSMDLTESFKKGIKELSATYAAMRIRELPGLLVTAAHGVRNSKSKQDRVEVGQEADETAVEPLIAKAQLDSLKQIRSRWDALPFEERMKFAESLLLDPWIIVERLVRLLSEGRYRAPVWQPFHGAAVRHPMLHRYAASLDSIRHCVSELVVMARMLGQNFDSVCLIDAIDMEICRLKDLAATLEDPDGEECKRRISAGRTILESAIPKLGRAGRIRPHLLFAYARAEGLLEKDLIRSL